eukprot:TRINITY_DN2720_c0_g1_i3.p1 TRINITY_DN2720_c0_g1~~TRINITY_DN2720_c0_g1_i3.p1  ORF type:complete len:679 (-),score=128.88 TRINITY_DN2720_c0_g1_i3:71-2107(-)
MGKKVCLACNDKAHCFRCKSRLDPAKTTTWGANKFCNNCVCANCTKVLKDGQFKPVNGVNFCNDCLCTSCHKPAGVDAFHLPNGKFCTNCVCYDCHNPFDERGYVERNNHKYCPDCLCKRCSVLLDKNAVSFNGTKFCRNCLCGECRQPLDNNVIATPSGTFHKYCACHRCSTPFNKQTPIEVQGNKYCVDCVCGDCTTPLDHSNTSARKGSRNYHIRCLCKRCENPFAGRPVTNYKGMQYCPDCVCGSCSSALHAYQFVPISGRNYCYSCVCAKCKTIFPPAFGQVVKAGEKSFCYGCSCTQCKKPLVERTGYIVNEISGAKHCVDCVCSRCEDVLVGNNYIKGDKKHCRSCICVSCEKPLSNVKAYIHSSRGKHCTDCFCARCEEVLAPGEKSTTSRYCRKCLCQKCSKPLDLLEISTCHSCQGKAVTQANAEKIEQAAATVAQVAQAKPAINKSDFKSTGNYTPPAAAAATSSPSHSHSSPLTVDTSLRTSSSSGLNKSDFRSTGSYSPTAASQTKINQPYVPVPSPVRSGYMPGSGSSSPKASANVAPASPTNSTNVAIGNCAECGTTLAGPGTSVSVNGAFYHKSCFTCFKCRQQLTSFTELNKKPYCQNCFRAATAPTCNGCKGGIVTGATLKALDAIWHPECFVCTACKKQFGKMGYTLEDGRPYHATCLE